LPREADHVVVAARELYVGAQRARQGACAGRACRAGGAAGEQDLLQHECITFRSQTNGSLYAWELERGRKTWRVPVRGGVVANEPQFCVTMAEQGVCRALAPIMAPYPNMQLRRRI
jgi:hypothetical protein